MVCVLIIFFGGGRGGVDSSDSFHQSHKCYCFTPASFISPAQPNSGSRKTCPIYLLLKPVFRVQEKQIIGPGAKGLPLSMPPNHQISFNTCQSSPFLVLGTSVVWRLANIFASFTPCFALPVFSQFTGTGWWLLVLHSARQSGVLPVWDNDAAEEGAGWNLLTVPSLLQLWWPLH